MCSSKRGAYLWDVIGYTLPRLHEGKEWYVDFYCTDPETGKMKRKKYSVRSAGKRKEKRAMAAVLIERLCLLLRQGWNPWEETSGNRGTVLFDNILNKYLSSLELSHRKVSVENYRSRVNVLRQYMSTLPNPPKYAYQYDRAFIVDFLDWVTEVRGANARTRNNYRGWCSALGEFMVERDYISENPAANVRKMQETKKRRQPIDERRMRELFRYLESNDKRFLLACMMEYYTFIRPHELLNLRLSDISLKESTVFISAEHSKNKRDGKVSLNERIIKLMLELGVFKYENDNYLFGRNFLPSSEQAPDDIFNKRWAQVRRELGWPEEIKFYSLKDSGIRDLSNAAGVVTARNQARHTDISTTNKYLQGRDLDAPEAAKQFSGCFTE